MVVYCTKKICAYNSACCSHYDEKTNGLPRCKLEDILIDEQVECANFKAEFNKIDICKKCSRRTGVISFNLDQDININFKEAPELDNKYKK